jgi:hypothetical protein
MSSAQATLFKAKIMPLDFEVAHGYQQWQTIEL